MNTVAEQNSTRILHVLPMPSLWHWCCGLLVIISTFACTLTGKVGIWGLLPYHTLVYGVLTPFLLSFFEKYNRQATSSLKILAGILAFIFSQFVTVEGSYYHVHNWSLCFGSNIAILIWLFRSLSYGFVFYKIILGICILIEQFQLKKNNYKFNIWKWFLLIVFARIIALGLFYPCVFGFDAAVGLRTFLDPDCATCNHHPYFIQLIHGFFFRLGQSIGHISVGFAILSLLSIIFSSSIIIYGLKLFEQTGLSRKWLLSIAFIYAFFPLFPYLSVNPTKDSLFAYSLLLYIFTLYKVSLSKAACMRNVHFSILHGISILLVCLARHQGIYFILPECLLLLICYRHSWKQILIATLPALLLVFAYSKMLLPYNNVEPGGKQEVYGTFFHQTAYYLQQHPEDVTVEELAAINKVLNSDTIAAKYTYNSTDAVKNGYKYNPWYRAYAESPSMFRHIDHSNEADDLKSYRQAWLSMGYRHPLTYIEASLGVSAGFFYNFNRLILETSTNWAKSNAATTPEYRFAHFNKAALFYNKHIYSWFKVPIINWIIAIPYYNWAAIFLIAMLFYRKDFKGLVVFLPVFFSIGILLICPMIYGRYSYPIVITLPLLLAYILTAKRETKEL